MSVSSEPKVHPVSTDGYKEGKAELYDAIRPSYVPEVLAYILKSLEGRTGLRIVEIASGTGKLTRSLLSDPEWNKRTREIRCIEPNEGMRNVFSKTMEDTRAVLSDGTFDNTGAPDQWADLIIIATAFHWCLHLEPAITEFVHILKPDGLVCLLWNLEDPSRAAWVAQLYDICLPYRDNTPSSAASMLKWREIFDLPVYKANFSEPEETSIAFNESRSVESIVSLYLTWSGIALLPDESKDEISKRIREVIKRGDELVWIDEKQSILEAPFVSPIVIFQRIPGNRKGEHWRVKL